jgi:transposase
LWLTQFDRGALTDEEADGRAISEYEARIAARERKVGHLTMELDLAKKIPRLARARQREMLRDPRPIAAPSGGGAKS